MREREKVRQSMREREIDIKQREIRNKGRDRERRWSAFHCTD